MPNTKTPEFTVWLATTVTPAMKEEVVSKAKRENVSISEIQRRALALFLAQNDTKCVAAETKSVIGGDHAA